jgi:hypothetical protein
VRHADGLTGSISQSAYNQRNTGTMSQFTNLGKLLLRAAPIMNVPVAALANSPRFGRFVGRNITMITYTGRRSGNTFSIPVAYRRNGDEIEITPNMPDAKTWWRNFLGDGAPLTLSLDGTQRPGHAVAQRDDNGHVNVIVRLANS